MPRAPMHEWLRSTIGPILQQHGVTPQFGGAPGAGIVPQDIGDVIGGIAEHLRPILPGKEGGPGESSGVPQKDHRYPPTAQGTQDKLAYLQQAAALRAQHGRQLLLGAARQGRISTDPGTGELRVRRKTDGAVVPLSGVPALTEGGIPWYTPPPRFQNRLVNISNRVGQRQVARAAGQPVQVMPPAGIASALGPEPIA